ncbi:MAG: SURF1 family protein [Dyella sp.]
MIGLRRPTWWACVLTVLGALLFVRLGVWQLDRANEKEAIMRRYAAADAAPRQDFAAAVGQPPADALPRLAVRGRYLVDRLYLLDNPRHDQRGGVEVYAPLRPNGDDRLLLVDLGFLPGNGSGQSPQVPPLSVAEVSLVGLYQPPPGVGFEMGGDAFARQSVWPKTTVYLDLAQLAADLQAPLYPRVLALDPEQGSIYLRRHSMDFSAMPPSRHRAYAFQWFTFALAAVVIMLVVHRKPPLRSDRR